LQPPVQPKASIPVRESTDNPSKQQSVSTTSVHSASRPKEVKQSSLFDLFENVGEPAKVVVLPKKAPVTTAKRSDFQKRRINPGYQPDLFSSTAKQSNILPKANGTTQINGKKQEVTGDLFSQTNGNGQSEQRTVSKHLPDPAPFGGELQSFYRNDCLVIDKGW